MLNFGILLKSYDEDFDLAERLIESFNRFNPERLQMFIVVPESDLQKFRIFESDTISVLSESLLGQYLVDHEVAGIRPGYINQEIVKLSFWELGFTSNYFCVDSDAVFIRPISVNDFMFDESTPYTVLVEDNELKSEPRYYEEHWKGREPQLRKIQELVGLKDKRILTCHGHQIFSSKTLQTLRTEFMNSRGWSYSKLLEQAPYEFSWYNMWLQVKDEVEIKVREPIVKVFHNQDQLLNYLLSGTTVQDLARAYVAVVINSNFSSEFRHLRLDTGRETFISQLLSWKMVIKILLQKIRLSSTRIVNRF